LYIFWPFLTTDKEKPVRVALVHDWLTGMRGGEKCLEVLCELFPHAEIYTLLHIPKSVSPAIEALKIETSFIQRVPFSRKQYRKYLPLFPMAIERFSFEQHDVIISTSHCVAKGAVPRRGALHICYCHTPMRYVWEAYDSYFGRGRTGSLTRLVMPPVARYLRAWDVRSSDRVNHFIANSKNVQERIRRHYNRDSEVIYPPVDVSRSEISTHDGGYFLIVSAFAPYKRIDLAIEAFNKNGRRLVVIGDGQENQKLRYIAKSNVEFVGWVSQEQLAQYYQGCSALIFPGEEDFGIVPLEAMAAGKPVIAYRRGGTLETVIDTGDARTGIFFKDQNVESLLGAIEQFHETTFDPYKIREQALRFDRSIFKMRMKDFLEKKIVEHFK
jgi:glycosyltransferase involved in cell wall biosynthesis